jgi:hypothetical protein
MTHTKTLKFESHKQWTLFMKILQNLNFICSIFLTMKYTNVSNHVFLMYNLPFDYTWARQGKDVSQKT